MCRKVITGFLMLYSLLLLCPTTSATWAHTDLKSQTVEAVAIVVARVDDVRLVGDARIAWATVLSSFKNLRVGQRFTFRAQKIASCDISYAVIGETVLLFLENSRPLPTKLEDSEGLLFPRFEAEKAQHLGDLPFYFLAREGRGRTSVAVYKQTLYLPVNSGMSSETGKTFLYFHTVILPAGIIEYRLPVVPHEFTGNYAGRPGGRDRVFRYIRLKDVGQHITKYVAEQRR
jgi:hypothetical protein